MVERPRPPHVSPSTMSSWQQIVRRSTYTWRPAAAIMRLSRGRCVLLSPLPLPGRLSQCVYFTPPRVSSAVTPSHGCHIGHDHAGGSSVAVHPVQSAADRPWADGRQACTPPEAGTSCTCSIWQNAVKLLCIMCAPVAGYQPAFLSVNVVLTLLLGSAPRTAGRPASLASEVGLCITHRSA